MIRRNLPVIVVTLVSWAIVVLWGVLLDDHFGRITLGYQWLTYGDVPFRDFFDPGLFGAAAWSAVALWLSNGSLLGEMVLDGAAIGVGLGLTCALATRASGSTAIGVLAAALTFASGPRLYDYDKVLLYPLGLWACWRYADRPSPQHAIAVGLIIGFGSIFRYDTALYLGAAWLATLLSVHGFASASLAPAAISVFTFSVVIAPVVLWLQYTVGLRDAIDQAASYARIERARTRLFDWAAVIWGGGFRQAWVGVMSRGAAAGWLYLALLALVPLGLAVGFSSRGGPMSTARNRIGRPHILSAAVLCGMLVLFILRDPLPARFGAMLSVASVLAASIARPLFGTTGGRRSRLAVALTVACGIAVSVIVVRAGEIDRFERLWLGGPQQVVRVGRSQARMLTEVPPALGVMPGGIIMRSLAWYLRQCTPPDTPVMATWFAPHVYFFAQRPFAGGMWAYFGDHWTRPDRQLQVLDRLKRDPPSIVVVDRTRVGDFEQYSLIAQYLLQAYRRTSSTSFERGTTATYDVFVPRESNWGSRDPVWGLVCAP